MILKLLHWFTEEMEKREIEFQEQISLMKVHKEISEEWLESLQKEK